MDPALPNRRSLLRDSVLGLGSIALSTLLAGAKPLPHHRARAKNVIFYFAGGGVSQLDLFDPKPELVRHHGEAVPRSLIEGQRFAFIRGDKLSLLSSPYQFRRYGAHGQELSELLPQLGAVADHTTVFRALRTDEVNHTQAQLLLMTGHNRSGRPSLGAWASYGLGSENADLPTFVVLNPTVTTGSTALHSAGFLPSHHQGIRFSAGAEALSYLSDPPGMARGGRRATIDTINAFNRELLDELADPEIATRIAQYELAFRMQAAAPEAVDLSRESAATLAAYGAVPGEVSVAGALLLARRLVERGVRFVQIRDGGWDHHSKLYQELPEKCRQLDRPLAALVRDLHQRGLLEETLIVWAGEFGRTPMLQGAAGRDKAGRDHHKDAMAVWLAGGGIQPGLTLGQTDDLGYHATEGAAHVHDLQATLLHLLGLDHERLTFRHQGRDFRLTDVHGHVIEKLLA